MNKPDLFQYDIRKEAPAVIHGARVFRSQIPLLRTRTLGRNDPCWCGSGKKFKRCCIDKDQYCYQPPKDGRFKVKKPKIGGESHERLGERDRAIEGKSETVGEDKGTGGDAGISEG